MARTMQYIGHEDDFIFGPYNAHIHLDDSGLPILDALGIPEVDRQYDAQDTARLLTNFFSNGVFPNPTVFPTTGGNSAGFQVMALHQDSMNLTLRTGTAFIDGHRCISPLETVFPVPAAHPTLGRRDIIVIRHDIVTRSCLPAYVMGVPALTPQIPTLERTDDFWELQLAVITVNPNMQAVTQAQIQDTRPDNNVCGFVTHLVHTIDTRTIFAQFDSFLQQEIARWTAERNTWLTNTTNWTNQQQTHFTQLGNEIRNLITSLETGAFSTINFNFDDWFVRRGCNRVTTFPSNNVRVEYRVRSNNFLAAFLTTTFNANGTITVSATFNQWEMMQGSVVASTFPFTVTNTVTFNSDGSITEVIT